MRSVGQLPVVLYFIPGMMPTEAELNEAANLRASVRFRNASLVDGHGAEALEECDGVMGDVPERYRRAFGSDFHSVSGVGALRAVHDGEPGVTASQPTNMDSRFSGDWTEEDRKRAARGLSPNDPNSAPVWLNPNSKPSRADDAPDETFSGTNAIKPNAPLGLNGAANVTTAMLPDSSPIKETGLPGLGAGEWGAGSGSASGASVGSGGSSEKPLSSQSRAELNATAEREGVAGAEDMPNIPAVIAAIEAKRRGE